MNLHFVPGPVDTPEVLDAAGPKQMELSQIEMLLRDHYVTPRGMVAQSLPVGQEEAASFVAAFEDFSDSCLQHLLLAA